MPSSSKDDIVLVRYPFSDLSDAKVRPAVIVSAPHSSHDVFIVPLTSKLAHLSLVNFRPPIGRKADLTSRPQSSVGCIPSTKP
jgi:hypothetical protein